MFVKVGLSHVAIDKIVSLTQARQGCSVTTMTGTHYVDTSQTCEQVIEAIEAALQDWERRAHDFRLSLHGEDS